MKTIFPPSTRSPPYTKQKQRFPSIKTKCIPFINLEDILFRQLLVLLATLNLLHKVTQTHTRLKAQHTCIFGSVRVTKEEIIL